MKNRYFLPILSLFLLPVILTCQKETVEQDKDPVIVEGEEIKINVEQTVMDLSSAVVSKLEAIDTFEYQGVKFPKYELIIEATAEEVENIKPGTVLYIPTGTKGGKVLFVYEVEEFKKSGSQLKGYLARKIRAFQATLDQYFNYENAIVEFSTPDNRSKINSEYPNKLVGSSLPLADIEIKFVSEIDEKYKLEFSSSPDALCKLNLSAKLWESGDSYISAEGSLTVNPAIDLYMRYEPKKAGKEWLSKLEAAMVPDALMILYKDKNYFLGNMKQIWANVYTDIYKELTFNIHLSKEFKINPYRIPLGKLVIPTYPVSSVVDMAFEIDFRVMAELDLEYYEKDEYDIVLGVNLDRDLPEAEWYYEFNQRSESRLMLKAKVELTTGINLILETEIYVLGIFGPELITGTFMEATTAITTAGGTNDPSALDWKLSADAGVKAGATLNLSLFHIDNATWKIYTMVERTWRKNIYLAPESLGIEKGNNQTGKMGQPLPIPITIGAYDSTKEYIKFLPVPLYFETSNGSVEPSYMTLTNDGLASVIWTLDNENETQQLYVHFKDGGQKKEEITIYATAIPPEDDDDEGDSPTDTDTEIVEVINPATGRIWMDRNLGAFRDANSSTDVEAYGHYYQWGRAADRHQYRRSSTTSTLSSSDTPGHSKFILTGPKPYDWRTPQNDNLWQGVNGKNNPCPSGFRLPTDAEWEAEMQSWISKNAAGAYASPLKLSLAGGRSRLDGSISTGQVGSYWSSTVDGILARYLSFANHTALRPSSTRATGNSVRCIKD